MTNLITRLGAGARRALVLFLATLVAVPVGALSLTAPAEAHEGHGETEPFSALVFSKTAAFRHGSIEAGVAALEKLGTDHGFTVDATEDATAFTTANLAKYDVVVFLSTTGDVLDNGQQAAFEAYIEAGGGYAGIHAASDTEYDWEWYGDLVGAYFKGHPAPQDVTVKVEDPAHPSTAELPQLWERTDELYNYRTNPRGELHVLASYDESTYTGGDMGVEHPISWCQDYQGGRSWYTGMGHDNASFQEPLFLDHLLGGLRTAAGVLDADCSATLPESFEKVTLDDNTSNPMELAIAGDGRVVYIDRNGAVKTIRPDGAVISSGTVPVYTGQEFGLLGIALDPDFDTNGWFYLYHSPTGAASVDRVSRFTMDPTASTFAAASKVDIIDIPVQRNECCHAGGSLEFDGDGNLYIATGDNTNPFDSTGYNPIDEREGRSAWDAQRSSANTNSLSGKVLRITPKDDGGYDVPAGNLFPAGTEKTRPEVFAMGFRNPFRIGLDEQSGHLLVADYGPDAGADNPTRGPNGRVEWNILAEPGNYGWPYCVGDNTPYNDFNFATQQSGAKYDCAAPTNDSPNNTGLTQLPAAIPATMWQSNGAPTSTPEIGSSGAPMTSGTYSYDAESTSPRKWPAYFDSKAIWADWNNSRLFTVQMNEDGSDYTDLNRFLPDLPMTRPHALQFGPDGALYMIEWGSGFGGNNADSGVYRIDYVQGNRAPVASASADKTSGPAPLTVVFDSTGSRDPDGTDVTYAWDFDGDDTTDSTEASPTHTYTEVGDYTARLTVTDADGRTAVSNLDITVGNTAPVVELLLPPEGGFFEYGDTMKYEVRVTDAEDGTDIDCQDVVVQPALGHDEHAHGYEQYRGCSGTFPLPGDEGHVGANIFGTVTATYTDQGADGVSALQGQDVIVVHTKRKEAEYFDTTGRLEGSTSGGDAGVITEDTSDTAGGGQNAGYIEAGDWFAWDVMNLTKIDEISLRAASPSAGTVFSVRTGSPTGPEVASIPVDSTGDWQVYDDHSGVVSGDSATLSGPLYFVQVSGGSNVNWIDFIGDGITDNRRPVVTATSSTLSGTGPLTVDFTASATDPDGDSPYAFAWTFGDGATATTAAASHTYEAPGTYTATVTVTDARGATASKSFTIKVSSAEETCFTGRSDGFDGTELDTDRWDAVVRPSTGLSVADGSLQLALTATDIYGTGGSATPDIVLQHLPGGAFTATTKVTIPAVRQYQQAGLIVYGDDDNYLKLVVQGRTATPDKAGTIVQFAKEAAGTATETNTNGLGAALTDTVWLRLVSPDGLATTAEYSLDGETWVTMAGTRNLQGINEPRIGVFGLANNAAATPITAAFDYFSITPDDTATPCGPGEEEDTTAPEVDTTVTGSYAGTVESLIDTPIGGTATLESSVTGDAATTTATLDLTGLAPSTAYESHLHTGTCDSLGLHYRDDPDGDGVPPNELWPTQAGWTEGEPRILSSAEGTAQASATVAWAPRTDGRALVLHREGAIVACATLDLTGPGTVVLDATDDTAVTSLETKVDDGEWVAWTAPFEISEPGDHTVAWRASDEAGNESTGSFPVVVPDSTEEPEEPGQPGAPTVTATLSPGAPNGSAGWYRTPVTLTMAAAGGQGASRLEYRLGDGPWTAYAGPVVLGTDGTVVVTGRATDAEGQVSQVVSATVRIDATAPVVSLEGLTDGAKIAPAARRKVSLAAADATSGVATSTVRLDGRVVSLPTRLDAVALKAGKHRLDVTVTDAAGNATTTRTVFTVKAGYGGGKALVRRLEREDRVTARVADRLIARLVVAQRADQQGRTSAARAALGTFLQQASAAQDGEARKALEKLGRSLRSQL